MTKEQKEKMLDLLADSRKAYVIECERKIVEEKGKITGADYMFQHIAELVGRLKIEDKPQESEEK